MRPSWKFDGLRSGCAWMCAAVLCALSGLSFAQDVPLVSGNYDVARKFFHGDAHVLLLGDSIQNGMIGVYPKVWEVDKWVGQVVGPNLNSTFAGNTGAFGLIFNNPKPAFVNTNLTHLPDAPPAGLAGFAPGAVQHVTFNAVEAPPGGILDNRFLSYGLAAGQEQIYFPGKWADRADGRIYVDALLYGNPQGIESGAQLDMRVNSQTAAALTIPLNARSEEGRIVKLSGSFPAQPWNPGTGISGEFRLAPGTTPQAGSNLPLLGMRIHTGEQGFQLANIAWGGKGIDYYVDPANTTDQNLSDYIAGTDSNMALIWLGQNDTGKYQPAQWKQRMEQLIARYKTARPDMDFILVSTYDTGSPILAGYSQALHEIAQSDPDVLFLNLHEAAGDFAFLNGNYLSDGVHPSVAGLTYFAEKTQELLELAESRVPEPGGILVMVATIWAVGRRRSRVSRLTRGV